MNKLEQMKKSFALFLLLAGLNAVGQTPADISLIFYVDENTATGTLIGTVSANDPDGDPVTYAISNGNEEGAFALDPIAGEITVADDSQLDFETMPSFSFTVEADDGNGGMTAVAISINLNDVDENVLGLAKDELKILVYPNHVTERFYINLGELGARDVKVSSFTVGGGIVQLKLKRFSDSTLEADATALGKGLHMIKILSRGSVRTFRIWKN